MLLKKLREMSVNGRQKAIKDRWTPNGLSCGRGEGKRGTMTLSCFITVVVRGILRGRPDDGGWLWGDCRSACPSFSASEQMPA